MAMVRNEVEVLALREFYQLSLQALDHMPEHFPICYKGADYTVPPSGRRARSGP